MSPTTSTARQDQGPAAEAHGRRVSAAFGPYRVAARFAPGVSPGRQNWIDPPGLPADFEATVELGPVQGVESLVYDRLDRDGFAFTAATSLGEGAHGRGRYRLSADVPVAERIWSVIEAMLATGYAEILRRGGLVLHAATLWLDGRAWVVAGQSGAGKTTLARRFPTAHLHEEHAFLVPGPDGWQVWRHAELRGPRDDRPWQLPLGGMLVLSKVRSHTAVHPIDPAVALPNVVEHAFFAGGAGLPLLLDAGLALVAAHPPRWLDHSLADPPEVVAARLLEGMR